MDTFRLLLFDLDDTLLHFDDYWEVSIRESLATYPLTKGIGLEELYAVFLRYDAEYHEQWLDGTIDGREFRRLRFIRTISEFGLPAGEEEAESFERWFHTVRTAHIPYDLELIAALQRLGGRFALGMVTNGTSEDQFNKLNRMGLDLLFTNDNVFVSETMGAAKPAAGAYLIPAAHFGVKPSETLFIGDSWVNDVAGPIAAGMSAVWMNRKGLPRPAEPEPFAEVGSLAELEAILLPGIPSDSIDYKCNNGLQ